ARAAAAARLLAKSKPDGAAAALLAYLPFAGDPRLEEEIRTALGAVAAVKGRPADVVVKALEDKVPLRRAAAAEALARAGVTDQKAAVLKVLKESEPLARLPIAQALLEARQKEAVPALIDLIAELPADEAWRAE